MQASIELAQRQKSEVAISISPKGGSTLFESSILVGLASWKPL
jgi:hypothetical protein